MAGHFAQNRAAIPLERNGYLQPLKSVSRRTPVFCRNRLIFSLYFNWMGLYYCLYKQFSAAGARSPHVRRRRSHRYRLHSRSEPIPVCRHFATRRWPLAACRPVPGARRRAPTAEQQRCEILSDEITTLAGHLNAANYRFLKLLDEFDRHDGWAGDGIRSLAHWLNFKCGIGELLAREKVRVARALRSLPSIDAAFERGEISYSKVRAMARVATPENEAELLNIARHGTAAHMERLVRAYRRCRKQVESGPEGSTASESAPGELPRRRLKVRRRPRRTKPMQRPWRLRTGRNLREMFPRKQKLKRSAWKLARRLTKLFPRKHPVTSLRPQP